MHISSFTRIALALVWMVAAYGMLQPGISLSQTLDGSKCSPPACTACASDAATEACKKSLGAKDLEGIDDEPFLYENRPIRLLQPLDDKTTQLPSEPGINIFFTYFNLSWPWVIGVAAGIAVLQALYGGVLIMLSGGKEQKEEGKNKLLWAIAGLLMIGLSGVILETLNPLFYVQV